MKKRSMGFTLIELLMVMGIIGLLASLTMVALNGIRKTSKINHTKNTLAQLGSSLENYRSVYGEYPPTSFFSVQPEGVVTGANPGIESLVQCLTTTQKGGPFLETKDEMLVNADRDSRIGNPSKSMIISQELFELCDIWGNPFVYIRAVEYTTIAATSNNQCTNKNGNPFIVEAAKSGTTGNYEKTYGYQIWSTGPNEENENGQGDDIPNWK